MKTTQAQPTIQIKAQKAKVELNLKIKLTIKWKNTNLRSNQMRRLCFKKGIKNDRNKKFT